jgi:hypothetical protein
MYSVAIDGTIDALMNYVSEMLRDHCGFRLNPLPSGSSKDGGHGWGSLGQKREINVKLANLRGFGSVSSDERDNMTLKIERAGDHWFLRISMQTAPRSDMFMWYILCEKRAEYTTREGIPI